MTSLASSKPSAQVVSTSPYVRRSITANLEAAVQRHVGTHQYTSEVRLRSVGLNSEESSDGAPWVGSQQDLGSVRQRFDSGRV